MKSDHTKRQEKKLIEVLLYFKKRGFVPFSIVYKTFYNVSIFLHISLQNLLTRTRLLPKMRILKAGVKARRPEKCPLNSL